MKSDIDNAKPAIVETPLTTPFNTSIELNVFPVIGIMNIISARYSMGIFTDPNNGKSRLESYAPSKIIGTAQNARARGLNQPPIVFLSSIIPTKNARPVVIPIANISVIGKKKYKAVRDEITPTIIDSPPGLGISVFSFLLTSMTVALRFSNAIMTIGVKPYTEKNPIMMAIIAAMISCSII